eukprot:scaffold7446_cov403-Prasinococcus_capsulatus_cf.AAC.17
MSRIRGYLSALTISPLRRLRAVEGLSSASTADIALKYGQICCRKCCCSSMYADVSSSSDAITKLYAPTRWRAATHVARAPDLAPLASVTQAMTSLWCLQPSCLFVSQDASRALLTRPKPRWRANVSSTGLNPLGDGATDRRRES